MKKTISSLLIFVLALSLFLIPVSGANHTFTDVDPESWYSEGVSYVWEKGLMQGVTSQQFAPHKPVTRAMMVTVLWRLAGSPEIDYEDLMCQNEYWLLSDIPENAYYETAALWAKVTGIMEGYPVPYDPQDPPTGLEVYEFRPENVLTREQLATVLYRYAKWTGTVSPEAATSSEVLPFSETSTPLLTFPDKDSVSSWAEEAMVWCVSVGLIQGSLQGGITLLTPKSSTTRAQLATIFMRFTSLLPIK